MKKITVVGSLNIDLVVDVPRLPKIGETITGNSVSQFPGGKGANQAVAASRLGNKVSIIGTLGSDAFGETLKSTLISEGIVTDYLKENKYVFTGTATIFKTKNDKLAIPSRPMKPGNHFPSFAQQRRGAPSGLAPGRGGY